MTIELIPNRLTHLYSKNYYKEKNYLLVKTVSLNIQLLSIVISLVY